MMENLKLYKLINLIFFTALAVKKGSSVYNKENILILVVDDLRPLLADWGDNLTHAPNINSLAAKSVVFKNAFAQQALCAPSRNSFLTGRRPDTLQLYDFYSYWRNKVGNFTTMPQYFKENGYKTYSFGKVFHPGISSNFTDDYPISWSEKPYHPPTEKYKDSRVCMDEDSGILTRNLVCPVVTKFQPEGTLPDIQITEAAITKITDHKKIFKDTPFFMAIGFHKPHIPLKFPKKYLDFYPLDSISLPNEPFRPSGMPSVAWNPWTDVKGRDDIRKLNISFPFGMMPPKWSLKIKQSYYAAITYIDYLIGNILAGVNLDNTIVVFTSDHGWSLGEHGEWAKYSNFDVALKIPLILYVPGLPANNVHAKKPKTVKKLVELIDIFPTLAELSGIVSKFPQCRMKNVDLCSEGFSLVPLVYDAIAIKSQYIWKHPAFSQFPRPGVFPSRNSDKPRLNDIKIMGYSIRTRRYRYTEWVDFNHSSCKPDWNKVQAKELYDHSIDENEALNLADKEELKPVYERLSRKLRLGWRGYKQY